MEDQQDYLGTIIKMKGIFYQRVYSVEIYAYKNKPIYEHYDNFNTFKEAEDFGKQKVKENGNGAYYVKWHYNKIEIPKIETPKRKIKLKQKEAEWIEHPWAEESPYGYLISNYECTHCHAWKRDMSNYCPECGYKMKGLFKNEKNKC